MNKELEPKELVKDKEEETIDALGDTITRLSEFEDGLGGDEADETAHTQSYHDSGHSYTT